MNSIHIVCGAAELLTPHVCDHPVPGVGVPPLDLSRGLPALALAVELHLLPRHHLHLLPLPGLHSGDSETEINKMR